MEPSVYIGWLDVIDDHSSVSGAVSREIERVHGEWLFRMRRDATDVCLDRLMHLHTR